MENIEKLPRMTALSARPIRWVTWVLLTCCAAMITLVLLSLPMASSYVQARVGQAYTLFGIERPTSAPVMTPDGATNIPALAAGTLRASAVQMIPETAAAANARPSVTAMPTNSVPVRRAGKPRKN